MYKNLFLLTFLLLFCAITKAQQRTIQVLSATIKDKKIEDAQVLLQKNGAQTVVGKTDANGSVTLNAAFADDINATIIIKKTGYSTLVAKCPCANLTYAISPVMQGLDGVRIVLSWGANPSDLDAHLAYGDDHVYYNNKTGENADLDVDDTNSYGPETITINRKNFGKTYVYAVHDFSDINNPNTHNLSNSQAKVFVYIGQSLVRTYYISPDSPGNLWTVFKINANGEMEDINTMNRINVNSEEVNEMMLHPHDAVSEVELYDVGNATSLNKVGEAYYAAKSYEDALNYFQQATQADPLYGQAYGNMGLTYKKLNRYAEAIWANRKAITMAHGTYDYVTRAGAYYNIGRIYEEKGEFNNALLMYKNAKTNKKNVVYDAAILRMQAKL